MDSRWICDVTINWWWHPTNPACPPTSVCWVALPDYILVIVTFCPYFFGSCIVFGLFCVSFCQYVLLCMTWLMSHHCCTIILPLACCVLDNMPFALIESQETLSLGIVCCFTYNNAHMVTTVTMQTPDKQSCQYITII